MMVETPTLLVHLGVQYEKEGTIPAVSTATSEEHEVILNTLHAVRAEKGDNFGTVWVKPFAVSLKKPQRCTSFGRDG